MFDPAALASMTPEEFQELLEKAAAANPEGFKTAIKGSADIKRIAKQAVGTGGSSRTPSFLEPIWPVVLICDAMLSSLGLERSESDDDTLVAVLAALDSKVEGSQEACTLEYATNGRINKVRLTVLSESNAANQTLDKALAEVEAANKDNFKAVADKYRKRVKLGRVDAETRKESLSKFDAAVAARKAVIEAAQSTPVAPPPPPA